MTRLELLLSALRDLPAAQAHQAAQWRQHQDKPIPDCQCDDTYAGDTIARGDL